MLQGIKNPVAIANQTSQGRHNKTERKSCDETVDVFQMNAILHLRIKVEASRVVLMEAIISKQM